MCVIGSFACAGGGGSCIIICFACVLLSPLLCGPVFDMKTAYVLSCVYFLFLLWLLLSVGYVWGLRLGIKCFFGVVCFIVWCAVEMIFFLQLVSDFY